MRKTQGTLKDVDKHYRQARDIAMQLIEQRARRILVTHPNLDEFIMGMGSWFFTRKGGEIIVDPLGYMKPISDIIDEWDAYLKLTGEPMRFTAEGETVTDW